MNPITEMGQYIAGSIVLTRAKKRFADLLGWESAQDLHADVIEHERQIADTAYKSEIYDREALRLMDEAQAKDSEGGEMITVSESKKIRALTLKSAEMDHDVAELATV